MTTGARTCPFTPLCERDLAGTDLPAQDRARLEQHLDGGCASCEQLIELHMSDEASASDPELDRLVGGAVDAAAERMAPSREAVLARVEEDMRRERQAQQRLRRRSLRALFYVTNVAAIVLLFVAYVGTQAVVRVRARGAQRLATETEIYAMTAALHRYVKERRDLPQDARALFAALAGPGGAQRDGAPYYRLDPTRLVNGEYLDDFGRPYRYDVVRGGARIYSVGPDGQDAGGQDDDLGGPPIVFVNDG